MAKERSGKDREGKKMYITTVAVPPRRNVNHVLEIGVSADSLSDPLCPPYG